MVVGDSPDGDYRKALTPGITSPRTKITPAGGNQELEIVMVGISPKNCSRQLIWSLRNSTVECTRQTGTTVPSTDSPSDIPSSALHINDLRRIRAIARPFIVKKAAPCTLSYDFFATRITALTLNRLQMLSAWALLQQDRRLCIMSPTRLHCNKTLNIANMRRR